MLFLTGCIGGGAFVPRDTVALKVLAAYRPEVGQGPHADYYLVQTDYGLAFLEKVQNGQSALATAHWQETDGDHFALWIQFLSRQGGAIEYVVPCERTKDVRRYFYPAGTYVKTNLNGVTRPVPNNREVHTPVRLIPVDMSRTEVQQSD